jgi:hypothetical protein
MNAVHFMPSSGLKCIFSAQIPPENLPLLHFMASGCHFAPKLYGDYTFQSIMELMKMEEHGERQFVSSPV